MSSASEVINFKYYFFKSLAMAEEEKLKCVGCTICCRHVAIELDKPDDFDEYTEIIWYLMHENIMVAIDHEDEWYIEFKTNCKALDGDRKCSIYDLRPNICRGYDPEECEYHGEGSAWKHEFHSREQFLRFLKKYNPKMYERVINKTNYKQG
jgi:Fe-S-cluster containining protein